MMWAAWIWWLRLEGAWSWSWESDQRAAVVDLLFGEEKGRCLHGNWEGKGIVTSVRLELEHVFAPGPLAVDGFTKSRLVTSLRDASPTPAFLKQLVPGPRPLPHLLIWMCQAQPYSTHPMRRRRPSSHRSPGAQTTGSFCSAALVEAAEMAIAAPVEAAEMAQAARMTTSRESRKREIGEGVKTEKKINAPLTSGTTCQLG